MILGQPKFNSIQVGELTVSFLGTTLRFEGKAAFVDMKTGHTHGWTKNEQWSPAVIEKLKELRALMEIDLGRLHLENGGESVVGPTTLASPAKGLSMEGGGLGEHLGGQEPPQV